MLDAKRAALIEREEARWQQIERAQEAERSKWDRIRNEGARNRTNVNSVPYNPVTLRYNDNEEGVICRKSDNLVRLVNARRFYTSGNSGFNPITVLAGGCCPQIGLKVRQSCSGNHLKYLYKPIWLVKKLMRIIKMMYWIVE